MGGSAWHSPRECSPHRDPASIRRIRLRYPSHSVPAARLSDRSASPRGSLLAPGDRRGTPFGTPVSVCGSTARPGPHWSRSLPEAVGSGPRPVTAPPCRCVVARRRPSGTRPPIATLLGGRPAAGCTYICANNSSLSNNSSVSCAAAPWGRGREECRADSARDLLATAITFNTDASHKVRVMADGRNGNSRPQHQRSSSVLVKW